MEGKYCIGTAMEHKCISSKILSYDREGDINNYITTIESNSFDPSSVQSGQEPTGLGQYIPVAVILAGIGTLTAIVREYKKIKNPENPKADKPYNLVAYMFGAGAIVSGILHFLN